MVKQKQRLTWKDLNIGCIVTEPGNARDYRTGNWRSKRPTYNFEKCNKCCLCYIYCPEGCVRQNNEGFFETDLYYCKGCGICAQECPTKVITMIEEES